MRGGGARCVLLPLLLAAAALLPAALAQGNSTAPAPSASASFVPRDDILLDCGATGTGNDTDGRAWDGDAGSKYAPANLGSASASFQDPSVPQVPYLTARVRAASSSAYQTATTLNFAYLVREFSVNVTGPALDLTFTPDKAHPNAYAFVNGIEVVS